MRQHNPFEPSPFETLHKDVSETFMVPWSLYEIHESLFMTTELLSTWDPAETKIRGTTNTILLFNNALNVRFT